MITRAERAEAGFTIVEMLVATMVLTVGIVALAGSTGLITRMIGRGRMSTVAMEVTEQRLERLRVIAASTTPPCTAAGFTSSAGPVANQGVTETWVVSVGGDVRTVRAIATYRVPGGMRADTLTTLISCR